MASDPQSQPATSWVDRLRPSPLRLLAPLLSAAILIGLVARVTDCNRASSMAPPFVRATRAAAKPALPQEFVPLRGTKSFGIEGPPQQPQRQPYENVQGLDTLNSLGGSKSGFGGLGLRGTGRMPAGGTQPSLGDLGAPGTNQAPVAPSRSE